jgi:hypothetical protein
MTQSTAMSAPVPIEVTEHTPPPSRTVTVLVRGVPVTVPCPEWCVGHDPDENLVELGDLDHCGEAVSLAVPTYSGSTTRVLGAFLAHYPFEDDEPRGDGTGRREYLAVDAGHGDDLVYLRKAAALAFADQFIAHGTEIQRLALQMPEDQA